MHRRCEQALLARGQVSEIMYCRNCRVFHVNVDAVTVHFDAAALRDLRNTLSAALLAHELMPLEHPASQPPADVH